jgi:probable F420-dependent oxidoreductase
MRVGIGVLVTDQTPDTGAMATLVEQYEFESMWLGEHSHIPIETVHAYSRDGSVPGAYKRFLDPVIALTVAACATTKIRLGTSITLPAEHNPIMMAKTIATLDYVSGGRLELGMGWGWNPPELLNNGVNPGKRRGIMREKIEAMQQIWTEEVFSYAGEHVQITDSWSWPKPVQNPHPPIYLGAPGTERNFEQIARWGNGWLPITKMGDDDTFPEEVAGLRKAFSDAGRDPASARVTLLETGTNTGSHTTLETFAERVPTREKIAQYAEWGVDRVVISVPTYTLDRMEGALDALAAKRGTWSMEGVTP